MIVDEVLAEHARVIASDATTGRANVTPYYPGEKHIAAEAVFTAGSEGSVTFPYAMPGDRIQRNQFSALWVIRVTGAADVAKAMLRRSELVRVFLGTLDDEDSLVGFTAEGETLTDVNPDGQPIQITTREGEDPKTGRPIAVAEITVPYETQTINEEG